MINALKHLRFAGFTIGLLVGLFSVVPNGYAAKGQVHVGETADEPFMIRGTIDEYMPIQLSSKLMFRGPAQQDVHVVLNSPGGRLSEGEKLLQIFRRYANGHRLICYGTGQVASAAFNFMSQCDVRVGAKGTDFMMHDPYLIYQENSTRKYSDLVKDAKDLMVSITKYREINRKVLRWTKEQIDKVSDKGDRDFTPEELKKIGWLNRIGEYGDEQ